MKMIIGLLLVTSTQAFAIVAPNGDALPTGILVSCNEGKGKPTKSAVAEYATVANGTVKAFVRSGKDGVATAVLASKGSCTISKQVINY